MAEMRLVVKALGSLKTHLAKIEDKHEDHDRRMAALESRVTPAYLESRVTPEAYLAPEYVPPHKRGGDVQPTRPPSDGNHRNWHNEHGKPRQYPRKPKTVEEMIAEYNEYNMKTYHLDTHTLFNEVDRKYLSLMESAAMRVQDITRFLSTKPVVLETHGGVGGDLLAWLIWGRALRLDSIENNPDTITRLMHNVEDVKQAIEKLTPEELPDESKKEILSTKVVVHHTTVREYLKKYSLRVSDIVYIDPNWTLPGMDREATPDEMQVYLQEEVLDALKEQGAYPMFIVVKTRHNAVQSRIYMKDYQNMVLFKSYDGYAFRQVDKGGGFWVHVFFDLTHPTITTWYHSQYFENVYNKNSFRLTNLKHMPIILPKYADDDEVETRGGRAYHLKPRYKEDHRPRDVSPTPSERSAVWS